ncbi:hypothetical protein IB277_20045 [Ensifer sp. ENS07]|uniref:hypothetical protein n=1 Tax=Ensifer sp. ENS07 TaxID=2769274 RepID=UPI00177B48AF|nr:hypothetical protein [Ensifer sp. ENS07]MBD9638600.1 hypothetical protein [Ensifer sp. ENS07]
MKAASVCLLIAIAAPSQVVAADYDKGVRAVAHLREALLVCKNLEMFQDYLSDGDRKVTERWKASSGNRFENDVATYLKDTLRPFLADEKRRGEWCVEMGDKTGRFQTEDRIRGYCIERHPDSFAAQANCFSTEMEGWKKLHERE